MSGYSKVIVALIAAFFAVSSVWAEGLQVSRYFSDNMVLQRDKPVKVWGSAKAGDEVTVSFGDQKKSALADKDGKWVVVLEPMKAAAEGKVLGLQSSASKETVSIRNVVVGDVWFFGRQTYVDISLGRNEEGRAAAAKYKSEDGFRTLVIRTIPAKAPQEDLDKASTGGWVMVDGKNALTMSAAAFYLGKDLVRELGVPVGIIDLNMGHYFGIGWMSRKAIEDAVIMNPKDKELGWLPQMLEKQAEERDSGKAQKELDEYIAKNPKGEKPSLGLHPLRNPSYPAAGYNAVIHPLRRLAMKGVLLQLGNDYPFIAYRELDKNATATVKAELDAAWGDSYVILKNGYRATEASLPYVPGDWRSTFGDEKLPIGLVLPPSSGLDVYASHNRDMRELHRRTAEREGGMGLIMPGNENIPLSGQPADDKLLAERCRVWVLGAVEAKPGVTATGPMFERLDAHLSRATVHFKEGTADSLKNTGDALNHFETAGPDLKWEKSNARIAGSAIELKSEGPIQFVRFNWDNQPDQGLVNGAGLPALPFNTEAKWSFGWLPPEEQPDLPAEYNTTANKWGKSDVAIINGQIANLESGDSEPIPTRLGPLGIVSSPFGPNIYVRDTDPGTPAEGKIKPGDVIYGVNGKIFDDSPGVADDAQYHVLADAITYSESEAGRGKIVLSLRRGRELMDVELRLQVLGTYSSTTPYYCEKSENIVRNAEKWFAKSYRPETGLPTEREGMLNTDLLFILASGTPEQQGLVRRAVYKMMAGMDPKPVTVGMESKPWHTGYESLLLGEYFNATGDRNVLPYLKYLADLSAESQLKPPAETTPTKEAAQSDMQVGGWRQTYPGNPDRWQSGYGLMPHAGMSCVMGLQLAKEAGLPIDELALKRGLVHFSKGRAEYAFVLYSYGNLRIPGPHLVNPDAEARGKLASDNGKLGTAAALYSLVKENDTVEICSRQCVYAFNNTRTGHGGMFFNNFWTPIGAWAAGEAGFKHFMKGQTWWRELYRRSDGSFNQVGRGGIGVSYAIGYVAPEKRLRILGAPKSAFGANCPYYLKLALEAHQRRDYAAAEKLILKEMDGIIPAEDMPVVNHMLDSVRILRASIEHDLSLVERLIKDGKYYYASLELPQLKGVVSANDPRLKAVVATLESPDGIAKAGTHRSALESAEREMADQNKKASKQVEQKKWTNLIPSAKWQMKVVENVAQAPEGWTGLKFDDSGWNKATLPISWTMYHTALFRGKFTVNDKEAIGGLRIAGKFFQQQNVLVYLNGELVAKVDEIDRGLGTVRGEFNEFALKQLRNGENTVSLVTRHKRRWGSYRGTYKTAERVEFTLEGLEKPKHDRDLPKR
jgi:sialate O-acetylesterase